MGSLSFWCRGWSGTLFIFSAWTRSLACLLPLSSSTPVVFSISAMGVVFMAPRIVLKPMFWTLSSLLMCVLAAVAQALAPYSGDGRTAPMWTVFRILELAPRCVPDNFFRTASFLMPSSLHVLYVCLPWESGVKFYPEECESSVLPPSFMVTFSLEMEREKTGLSLHFTDLTTPVICPLLYLVHSFLDSGSRRCGVLRCTPHSEIICT